MLDWNCWRVGIARIVVYVWVPLWIAFAMMGATAAPAQPSTGQLDGTCQQQAEPFVCLAVTALRNAGYWGFPVDREEVVDLRMVLKEILGAPDGSTDVETARLILEDIRGRIPGWIEGLVDSARNGSGLAANARWRVLQKQCGEDFTRSGGAIDVFEEGLSRLEAGTPFDWEEYNQRASGEAWDCQVRVQNAFVAIKTREKELRDVVVHLRNEIDKRVAGNCDGDTLQLARQPISASDPLTPCEIGIIEAAEVNLARRYEEARRDYEEVRKHSFDFMKNVFRLMVGPLWFTSSMARWVGDDFDISFVENFGEDGREWVDRMGVQSGIVPENRTVMRSDIVSYRDWSGVENAPRPEQVKRDDRNMQRVDYENEGGQTAVRFYRDRETHTKFWLYLGDDEDPTVFANDENTDIQENNKGVRSWRDINEMKIEGEVLDGNRIRFRGQGISATGDDILFTFMEIGSDGNLRYTLTIEE